MNQGFAMLRRSSFFLCCAFAAAATQAADIYQWVDDSGRMQASDVVPDKYKATARRLDSQRFELSAAQKAEAQTRRASSRKGSGDLPGESVSDNGQTAPAASLSGSPRAAHAATDCETLRRRYDESQACFSPFKNVNGTMKPGANEACTEVPDPSPQCGLPRLP